MRIEFHGRGCDISDKLRAHAEPRIQALETFFDRIADVRVTLSVQRAWKTIEITLDADNLLLRAEERTNDELASFDKALDRLERQLRRYRDRVKDHSKASIRSLAQETEEPEDSAPVADANVEAADDIVIVRTKAHALKPMTPQEAALQMEMLGHDFFVFLDGENDQVGVVYRRRDGGYGLIEPTVE